jgi:DNA-binding CsgD family transcriptional regulator
MNGVPARAHIGRNLHQILGNVAPRIAPAFEHVFATGLPLSNYKLTGQLPARREIAQWVEDYYPIREKSGKVVQVGAIVVEVPPTDGSDHALHRLTPRERQVVRFLAEGKSSKEMADILEISVRTVETYRARMMLKLDLHSTAEVARFAVRNNMI